MKYIFDVLQHNNIFNGLEKSLNDVISQYPIEAKFDLSFLPIASITVESTPELTGNHLELIRTELVHFLRGKGITNFILKLRQENK